MFNNYKNKKQKIYKLLHNSSNKKEKYKANVRIKDKNKIYVNNVLKEFASIHNRNKGKAIILDSEKLFTTKKLLEIGMKSKNILIPNPYVYEKIVKKHPTSFNCLLGDLLVSEKINPKTVSVAFFDYMSTLEGNKEVHPKTDIKNYFYNHLPKNNSIFGITISLRKDGVSAITQMDALISREAYHNGYITLKLPEGYSYNGMYFAFYKIISLNS